MLRVSQLGALALAAGALATAAAAAPCPEKDRGTLQEWLCFGEVEYASQTAGRPDGGARFVVFANKERLFERREAEGVKTKLEGDGYSLYRGLSGNDSTNLGNHYPFLFFGIALMPAFIALAASESTPAALPMGTTQVQYVGEGKAAGLMREMGVRAVKGTIERVSATDYLFKAEARGSTLTDEVSMSVSGRWSSALIEPYRDSMPVSGWQYHCAPQGADWRGNHRLVPPGVTLGDVRRGWRGPCD